MSVRIIIGDVREQLPLLAADSFDCIVTSPPYFGLRDYGVAGQIGLEPSLSEYLDEMVAVCRELRRVLKPDGTFWLNIGDSYANDTKWGGATGGKVTKANHGSTGIGRKKVTTGLKAKDLCMVPSRLAIRLQEDGWYVRSEIIWHKPNPMPESVTDRPTSAHEKIFLLTKSGRYYFDGSAIAEQSCSLGRPQREKAEALAKAGGLTDEHLAAIRAVGVTDAGKAQKTQSGFGKNAPAVVALAAKAKSVLGGYYREFLIAPTVNARNVWTMPTRPFADAHFATFPPELAERCIMAGCPIGGHILDPFGGAGTTGLVADRLQRDATLIELNPEYAAMARARIHGDAPLFAEAAE